MVDFIQYHTGIVVAIFSILVPTALVILFIDRKRRQSQNLPLSQTAKAWVFIVCANLIFFGGFIIGVLASH